MGNKRIPIPGVPEPKRVAYGRATVTWGPRFYGPDYIVANAPVADFDDLLQAVKLAHAEQHGGDE